MLGKLNQQNAVFETGVNFVGIHIKGQGQNACEAANAPLLPMPNCLFRLNLFAFALDRELIPACDVDFQRLQIEARQFRLNIYLVGVLPNVDGRKR